jgi:hypothetical protein
MLLHDGGRCACRESVLIAAQERSRPGAGNGFRQKIRERAGRRWTRIHAPNAKNKPFAVHNSDYTIGRDGIARKLARSRDGLGDNLSDIVGRHLAESGQRSRAQQQKRAQKAVHRGGY